MEQKGASLGSSLPVPSVQEWVKESMNNNNTIPSRYVHSELDQPFISDKMSQFPVIDMSKLLTQDSELQKLHSACIEWGFFQLINHGVSDTLLEKVKTETQDFFNLSMEEKKKYWQYPGELEGFGQAFVVSEEQKLNWCDIFYLLTQPKSLRKPHLFSKLPLPFRDALDAYSLEVKMLADGILEKLAKALNVKSEEIKETFDQGLQSMRMNYYPPCPQPDKAIGINPHSDPRDLTILLQVNEVEGLQIKKDGEWVPVKPLPNAFIVNVGDMLEIKSNGTYRSIEHRGVVNSAKERLSIATFYCGRYDGEVKPASSLITEERPALFKTVTVKEYLTGFFSRPLSEKSYLDTLRI